MKLIIIIIIIISIVWVLILLLHTVSLIFTKMFSASQSDGFLGGCGAIRQASLKWVYRNSWEELPGIQVDGQAVHSLKGVTMQSFLQGSKQGRTVSGRAESEHLNIQTNSCLKFSLSPRRWMINVLSLAGNRPVQRNNCPVLDITHLPTENMTDYMSHCLHTQAKGGQI